MPFTSLAAKPSPAQHIALANSDSKGATGAEKPARTGVQPVAGAPSLRRQALAGGDHASAAPALRRAHYVSPLDTGFWIEHHGKQVMKALDGIRELPRGSGNEVLLSEPWWPVRRPLEQLLRVAASGAALNLADRIAQLGRGKDGLARDTLLASELAQSAPDLVKAFGAAAPVLQKVLERVKQLAKGMPSDAAQYVIANAVLVCGFAAAARALKTNPDATPEMKRALDRLREVAQALAQSRPQDLTDSLCWASQRERLGQALGAAEMDLKTALLQAFPEPVRTAMPGLDSKHSVIPSIEIVGNDADQPPELLPLEPGLPDFVARQSSPPVEQRPVALEMPAGSPVAGATFTATPGPDADDRLEAPEFHTLNQPPQTPPQAGTLPANKASLEVKPGAGPSEAGLRRTSEPSASDSDEDAGRVQFHAGPDGEWASPAYHLRLGAPPSIRK